MLNEQRNSMDTIKVVIMPNGSDVDSRAFSEDGSPLIGKDGAGNDYHLGQISSSTEWAIHDMQKHFVREFDELYPDGWQLEFSLA